MEQILKKIVAFMEENGDIEHEDQEVYLFALRTVVVYVGNILSGVLIGAVMGVPVFCLIFLLSFILLRQEAGGYHAPGWKSCYVLSCGILILTLLWIKGMFAYQTCITVAVAAAEAICILVYAPLADENKPLNDERERAAVRKRAQTMVLLELVTGMLLLLFQKQAAYAVFGSVIWCGISYQAWFIKKYAEKNEKNKKNGS